MTVTETTQTTTVATFWRRHGAKLGALAFWALVLGGYWWYANRNGLTLQETLTLVAHLLTGSIWGPLAYILLYALRPLIFFPATLLTVLSGFLFGPWGILYTILGSNTSAMVAYGVGRYFGQGVLEGEENASVVQRYAQRMRQNSFETVLLMRLLFLPYDLVNYAGGFLRINWKAFLAATAIGSIPGTISFVLLGTSFGTLEALLAGEYRLNPVTLVLSVALIAGSIALSRHFKKRESTAPPSQKL
ncbi:MAG: TVP38/TMEM64 family protein [Anaerolineales bacterium]|nr:TVP38/TMEM64 family protein [Anaerolineales bacterium]MCB8953647.1 TVP38/TMEM64 family protein [Ardenticatenales bacterium]